MAYRRRANKRKTGKRRARLGIYRGRRLMRFAPSPTFTETFKHGSLLPNAGFMLAPRISQIPQITQYNALYQKYRILKVQYLIFPTWTGGENQNTAIFNSASGPSVPPGLTSVGTSRFVHVVDNSPDQSTPISESAVLTENGCKLSFLDKMKKLRCRPVPDLKDANGNALTMKGKYINFAGGGNPDITHYGIRGWITQEISTGTSAIKYEVYCKLTFQVAEPR
nr:MAG: capsid protein [Cressdnaviricota sp.]